MPKFSESIWTSLVKALVYYRIKFMRVGSIFIPGGRLFPRRGTLITRTPPITAWCFHFSQSQFQTQGKTRNVIQLLYWSVCHYHLTKAAIGGNRWLQPVRHFAILNFLQNLVSPQCSFSEGAASLINSPFGDDHVQGHQQRYVKKDTTHVRRIDRLSWPSTWSPCSLGRWRGEKLLQEEIMLGGCLSLLGSWGSLGFS